MLEAVIQWGFTDYNAENWIWIIRSLSFSQSFTRLWFIEYPTEDVSDTERCATYSESEGGDTRPVHGLPVVTVTPGEPLPGETKVTQKNLSPVAKADPARRQNSVDSFQRLATADDLYDMDKLDSVASSNPGTDFNKLATRDLILPVTSAMNMVILKKFAPNIYKLTHQSIITNKVHHLYNKH